MIDIRRPHRWALRGTVATVALVCLVPGPTRGQNIWDDPAFALYRQATSALEAKDYARAVTLAREATVAYPEHVLAYYLLGQAALAQQRWDDAAQALGKVTVLYPGAGYAQRDLGAAYQQLGRTEEAARAYEAALAIRPDDDESRSRMALMLVNAGQAARAEAHLTALAGRDTKLPDVYLALARMAYDRSDFAAAAAAFEKAATLRDSGRTWFNLGVVRVRLGNNQAAMQAFERAAQYAETKEQAAKEIEKIKAGPPAPARSSRPGLPR
jgi:tetratricopeptide (TPR) repeat protein